MPLHLHDPRHLIRLGLFEDLSRQLNAQGIQAFHELGPDAPGNEFSFDRTVFGHPQQFVTKNLLHGDHLPFHADDLVKIHHPAAAVAEAGQLDDNVDGRADLVPDGPVRNIEAGHGHHGLQAGHGIPGRVGVDGGERPVMPGVHGLEHIQGFAGPDLPQDDALRPHPQGVFNQVPLGDLPGTLQVGGPGFQADYVLLLHLEFGRVFDGDDALVVGDG